MHLAMSVTSAMASQLDIDYASDDDIAYLLSGPDNTYLDFAPDSEIPSQQGDDFCFGYESSGVNFNQGPELARWENSDSTYAFNFEGGSRCLYNQTEPPFDLIFADGFE